MKICLSNFVQDIKSLESADRLPVLGTFGELEMDAALDRGDVLPVAVRKALQLLSGTKKGFVMMVEGSRIDDYCHHHQTGHMAEELLDFDHATGGLTLLGGDRDAMASLSLYLLTALTRMNLLIQSFIK